MDPSTLSQPTLVLNRSWTAIATTPVRHALSMLFSGAAKVIKPDTFEVHGFESWADLAIEPDEPCIRTVRLRIKVPEIVLLTAYNGAPRRCVTFSRRNLYRRDKSTCQYCGSRPGTHELSIDHILPRSRGGHSSWLNCVLACMRCNCRKGNRTPREAHMRLLHKPVMPRWSPTLDAPITRVRQSWERFVSDAYWNAELEP